jgi:hypothetical protein
MYLLHFNQNGDALKVKFRRAVLLQDYRRLIEAAPGFAGIVLTTNADDLGLFAAVRLLQVLTESGRHEDARSRAMELKGMPRLMKDLEVQIAVAEVLGQPVPSRPRSPPLGVPPDVVPGDPHQPLACRRPFSTPLLWLVARGQSGTGRGHAIASSTWVSRRRAVRNHFSSL